MVYLSRLQLAIKSCHMKWRPTIDYSGRFDFRTVLEEDLRTTPSTRQSDTSAISLFEARCVQNGQFRAMVSNRCR